MDLVVLVARLLLAGVFVASAVAKVLDRAGSRQAVTDFGVPAALVGPVAVALPVAEVVAAVLLCVADPGATLGAVLAIVLLVAFTVAILVNLAQGNRPDCHCFGRLSSKPLGWRTVARNLVLMALDVLVLTEAGSLPAVTSSLRDRTATQWVVGAALVLLSAAVATLAVLLLALLRRYGAVLLRVEELEATVRAAGLVPDQVAAPFALPDLDGVTVSLAELLAGERPVLLALISPGCAACDELLPDLARWQDDPAGPVVAVVSSGTVDDNRRKIAAVPGLRVLLEDARQVSDGYGIEFTPGAVVIGPDGRVAGAKAYGAPEIRALHAALTTDADPALWQIGPRPLAEGDMAPDLELATEAGPATTLVAAAGDEAVVLFWDPGCGFAEQIREQVVALEADAPVLLVSRGDPAAVRASGLRSPLLVDPGFTAGQTYGAPGTPSAVRLVGGRVASAVAVGGPEVVALLESGPTLP